MGRPKNKVNPFLLQRSVSQAIRSLSRERRDLLGQAYLNVLNDFKLLPMDQLLAKYGNTRYED